MNLFNRLISNYKKNAKLIIKFTFAFFFITPFGILVHESGHLLVAKYLNYDVTLHHSSISWESEFKKCVVHRYLLHQDEIENNLSFEGDLSYYEDLYILNKDDLKILMGGVTITILFGTFFFVLLIFFRDKKFNFLKLLIALFSLFWLREIFILFRGFFFYIFYNKNKLFIGDEARIAELLNIYKGSIIIPLSIISIVIYFFVIKTLPKDQKYSFILGSVIGSFSGYFLWMQFFGPFFLPNSV